ncbi:ycii-related domain protein [Diplodia corticola]|uniref:Ycii-related domain protein n=1 Tax=Diplodia corticola TaxID=236234 RepID=A0A1J9S8J5_9PEZI|nr:ycii-related domain protein [Diplodia corticola]OJD36831.1 ycii-related domain protein [Diplodia corticola]
MSLRRLLSSTRKTYPKANAGTIRRIHAIPSQRSMATHGDQKCEWLVILPDQEGASQRRVELRPQHLSNLSKYPTDFWLFGGPFLQEPPKKNEPMKMLGSVLVALGSSKEEVLKELKKDIYTENRIWDWDKVQIFPFKSTLRKAL